MQATKLIALTLAIILSPRVAMTDLVGPIGHSRAGASVSATKAVEPSQTTTAAKQGTAVASPYRAEGHSSPAWTRSSTPKAKGRWGNPRRVPLLRRGATTGWGTTSCQSPDCPLTADAIRSFSNSLGARGRAKR